MIESLRYTVERKIGDVEIRNYPDFLIASVDGMTDDDAFRILFGYISGNNKSREQVAMTVPVISGKREREEIPMTTPVISTSRSFSFVRPSRYTQDTLSEASDERVRIIEIESRRMAVLSFKGRTNEDSVRRHEAELYRILERGGIKVNGESFLMRYNGPFTPGFIRHNEIAVEVAT